MEKQKKSVAPSSNWLALHKQLPKSKASSSSKHPSSAFAARKRRKLEHASTSPAPSEPAHPPAESHAFPRGTSQTETPATTLPDTLPSTKNGESLLQLRSMVLDQVVHTPAHKQPGKYLALDCEMVGVGLDGEESALARVSIVNFHGAVLLDAFVRPRERVVDYRTQFSGIRPADMVHAKSFEEVQKQVADLLKDRILVGHAVHNDLKALLLSHPRPQTRDTQLLFHKHGLVRGRRPALRNLVQQELGLTIQSGEHSSVTDARATMALFRLHRKQWEKDVRPLPPPSARARSRSRSLSADPASSKPKSKPKSAVPAKRARAASPGSDDDDEADDSDAGSASDDDASPIPPKSTSKSKSKSSKSSKRHATESFPGGGRRGVSSGLSTVVKVHVKQPAGTRAEKRGKSSAGKPKAKEQWWKDLGGAGAKGSLRFAAG